MASTTVKSSGGDYTTLSAWESDKQGDLVTATEGETVTCFDLEDTTAVVMGGWTSDATYYPTIQADGDHGGKWSTSVYRLSTSGLTFKGESGCGFMRVYGIQFSTSAAGSSSTRLDAYDATQPILFDKCIAKCTHGTPTGSAGFFSWQSTTVNYVNCLAYDHYDGFNQQDDTASAVKRFLNCGAHNCTRYGFYSITAAPDSQALNCWAQSSGTADFAGTWDTGTSYNASEDSSKPGTNGQEGAISFLDEANDDFHLAASGADTVAQDNGTDLSSYTDHAFSDDIDGDTRTFWSIGPDDGSAASGIEKTVSADAVLVDRFEKTISADGVLVARFEKTTSADGVLVGRYALSASADAILKAVIELTADADSVLVDRYEKTVDADGVLTARFALTVGADAVLTGAYDLTTSADGILVDRFELTTDVDSVLVGRFALTTDADAVLKTVTGITTDADSVLVDRFIKTVSADSVLVDRFLLSVSANALLGSLAYKIILARTGYITQIDTENGYVTQLRSRTGYITQLRARDGELLG